MFKGDVNYGIDMLLSGYETVPLTEQNSINLVLSNPYLKSNSMIPDKEDSPFYIAFHVNDPEGYQKSIFVQYNNIDTYEEWENEVIKTLPVENKKYALKVGEKVNKLSLLYQSCGNSLKEINLYNYDDIINSFSIKNKFNLEVFNNYLIPAQMSPIFIDDENNKYQGAQISLSLKEISLKEIDDLNNEDKYKLSQNGKVLKIDSLNGVKEYTIYVFNQKHEDLKYIQNICYLDSLKNKIMELKNETDPTYIGIYTTNNTTYTIKEEGIYIITVVANLEDNMPLNYIFKEFKYDSNLSPDDDKDDKDHEGDDGNDNTLVIVLSIVIPIIIIIIGILVFILWKKRKKSSESIESKLPIEDDDNQALVRETLTETNNNN